MVTVVLLAGCTSKSEPDAVKAPTRTSADDAEFDDTTGGLRGFVVNDEQMPLASAQLLLTPGDHITDTALDGGYSFSLLPPGDYTLLVTRLGYYNKQVSVEIVAGDITQQDVALNVVPVLQPRKEVLDYEGFLQCRWASFGSGKCLSTGICLSNCYSTQAVADAVFTGDKNEFFFKLTGEDWQEFVIEVEWTPSSFATNPEATVLFSYQGRPGNHEFGSSNNLPSPIWWNYTRGLPGQNQRLPDDLPKEPALNLTLRSWLAVAGNVLDDGGCLDVPPPVGCTPPVPPYANEPPAGVAYETPFHMAVTVFYSLKHPDGYTALTDE